MCGVERSEREFETRRFTLTSELDETLIATADEHYGGNKSLFLRSAIANHCRTLAGQDEFAMKSLIKEVDSLSGAVRDLEMQIEDKMPQGISQSHNQWQIENSVGSEKEPLAEIKRAVHKFLVRENQQQFTLTQIVDGVDADSISVQEVLVELTDDGYLTRESDENSTRFSVKV